MLTKDGRRTREEIALRQESDRTMTMWDKDGNLIVDKGVIVKDGKPTPNEKADER